jgi:hypothetical protein
MGFRNLADYTDSVSDGSGLHRFHSLRVDFVTGKANHLFYSAFSDERVKHE